MRAHSDWFCKRPETENQTLTNQLISFIQMGKVQRYKNAISRFIGSDEGQRFFNFAYSIGAAIVIWGALFKILHLPGGNALLCIGMGTEVLMFILTAFDRPPKDYDWSKVYPQLDEDNDEEDHPATAPNRTIAQGGGTVIIGNAPAHVAASGMVQAAPATADPNDMTAVTSAYLNQMASVTADMRRLQENTAALNKVSEVMLDSYKAITENSETISRSSTGYVEQMESLNRNIAGLNTIYELQLKSVSSQIDAIDRVNRGIKDIRDMYEKSASQSARYCEEAEKMARYMQQLNAVYEKMLTAMTANTKL